MKNDPSVEMYMVSRPTRLSLALASSLTLFALSCSGDEADPVVIDVDTGTPTPDLGAPDTSGPSVDPDNTSSIELPQMPYNYANIETPAHFDVESEGFHQQRPLNTADNTPADNPTTDAGATLGRVLFYDVNLSANRTVACASCHVPSKGFSDDRVLSVGFEGGKTRRHSMGLTNARYYAFGRFFWDQRANTLEEQALMPFQDPVEMGMTLDTLVARVQGAPYYADLFVDAFGDDEVTSDRIARAIAQFVRSIVSTTSKYDVGRAQVNARSDDFPNFTDEENLGKRLFSSPPPLGGFGCFVCHQGEGFIPVTATTNGLDAEITDPGYGEVTGNPLNDGTFKVPSLRNVGLRAPYMHDGRFATLNGVIEHYSTGVEASPALTGPLSAARQFNMTDAQKSALVAFLHTLTDEELVNDPKYSDPFVD